jgi:hypothetical protein
MSLEKQRQEIEANRMTPSDFSGALGRPPPSVSIFENANQNRPVRKTSLKIDDIPIQKRRKKSKDTTPTKASPEQMDVFEDLVEFPPENFSAYVDHVDALDNDAIDDFVNEEMSNRFSTGTTAMGGDSGSRLSRPMESRGSMETLRIEDHRGIFRPLVGPKLWGFDEISQISELPEFQEKSPFPGSYATQHYISNKLVVTSKKTRRLKKRTSMPGLNLQSMNKLKKMEERSRDPELELRLGRELAKKDKVRISQYKIDADKVTTDRRMKKDNPF